MVADAAVAKTLVSVGDDQALNTPIEAELQQVWIDRDLSWLDFNDRVLAEALDPSQPLLERAKFLAIVTANADEFFMKRISVLWETDADPALFDQVRRKVQRTQEAQARCWNDDLLPALNENGVDIRRWQELDSTQQEQANRFFDEQVSPALTPLLMMAGENFPFVSNLSTSLLFSVCEPETEEVRYARVKVPSDLSHWIPLKSDKASSPAYVRLHEIIQANVEKLYPGMVIGPAALVRITRDAEVEATAATTEGEMEEVRRQLRQRRFEPVVRLEFTPEVEPVIRSLLMKHFELEESDVYEAADRFDSTNLFELAGINLPALKDESWTPATPAAFDGAPDIFAVIRAGDVLVHHPYESFNESVERFVGEAAADPAVVAIKMTVYRVGDDTPFVRSLIKAAEAGKQVACVLELKARFDEERNLHWAAALVKAGAHVSFGIKGLKIHGKMALVVRKEAGGLRSYAHIGTGNYHSRTARLYCDFGLFTCDEAITRDVVSLFHHLTAHAHTPHFEKLLVAPHEMRTRFIALIEREIEHQRAGRPARIIAKLNQLEDPEIVQALCRASRRGVPVDLIVRGFCCLRPGVAGHTENIRVRSVIGRFLEHSRVYYFANGSAEILDGDFYIGSADWMHRNLSQRIEVVTPVNSASAKKRLADVLEICLNDRRQAWMLGSDGVYRKMENGTTDLGTHRRLMDLARNSAAHA